MSAVFIRGCCLLIHVLDGLEDHVHVEGLWCELCEFEEECAPVANVGETEGFCGERVVEGE